MNVICIEEAALYELIETVIDRLKGQHARREKWLTPEQAMKKLNIKSPSTLQKYRDEGRIRYSQRDRWHILYDLDSIEKYLEQNARNPF